MDEDEELDPRWKRVIKDIKSAGRWYTDDPGQIESEIRRIMTEDVGVPYDVLNAYEEVYDHIWVKPLNVELTRYRHEAARSVLNAKISAAMERAKTMSREEMVAHLAGVSVEDVRRLGGVDE